MHFKRFLVNQSVLFVLMYRMFDNFSVNIMPYLNQGVVHNIRSPPSFCHRSELSIRVSVNGLIMELSNRVATPDR